MLANLLMLILEAVFGFFTVALLARFYMQWSRVSFRNQIGAFVVALTDWIVVPARRFIPGLMGLDLASLTLAWLTQTLLVLAELWLRGFSVGQTAAAGALAVLLIGFIETIKTMIWLLIGVVIAAAVLSWISPYAALAPFLNALARPFLRPFQRIVPPIANVDLSPLVLLLALQVVLMVLAYLRGAVLSFVA